MANKELVITLKQKVKASNQEAFRLRQEQTSAIQSKNKPLANILGGDAYQLEVKARTYQEVIDMLESVTI